MFYCLCKNQVAQRVWWKRNLTPLWQVFRCWKEKQTTQQIVQQYPDVIEQILKKLEGATTITPEQIQTAVDAYLKKNPIVVKETATRTVPEWAKQPQKPAYTASEVDAEEKGAVEQHNSDSQAHPDIRRMITSLQVAVALRIIIARNIRPQINGRKIGWK